MIAIIGGSGFIGSRLCYLLESEGIDYIILDKNKSPFFPDKTRIMDIRDKDSYRKHLSGVETVINLAAEHRDDVTPKSLYDDVNIHGSEKLVALCEEFGIQNIIFTSSVAVYGFAPKGTDETGDINYFNDYGRTKWKAEQVLRQWLSRDLSNRMLTIIRPTVVFGERNRGNVYNLLRQISSGFFPMIGNGENSKSMAYVENVTSFIVYCLKNGPGEHLFNYVDQPDFDMNQLVIHVKKVLGKRPATGFKLPYFIGYAGGAFFDLLSLITGVKFPVSRIRIKKFCSDTMFQAANIKQLNFKPPVSLEDGIAKTIQYEFIEERKKDEILFYTE